MENEAYARALSRFQVHYTAWMKDSYLFYYKSVFALK